MPSHTKNHDIVLIKNPYAIMMATIGEITRKIKQLSEQLVKRNDETVQRSLSDAIHNHNVNLSLDYLAISKSVMLFSALEAFINLVTEVFVRPEFKSNVYEKRLYRDDLHLRILTLDKHCMCFEDSVFRPDNDLFKMIQYCIEVRNNLVHANIKPALRKKYNIARNLESLKLDDSNRIQDVVRNTIIAVIKGMKEEYKSIFLVLHSHILFGYIRSGERTILVGDEEDIQIAQSPLVEEYLALGTSIRSSNIPSFNEYLEAHWR